MVKTCQYCGRNFTTSTSARYCSAACRKAAGRKREADREEELQRFKAERQHDRALIEPYSRKRAQESALRQARIEQAAREQGLSYGQYQARLYMERSRRR